MISVFKYLSFLIGGAILVMIGLSLYLIATVKENDNDCMQTYVKELKANPEVIGYYYKTPYNSFHIDTREFEEYEKIGIVRGCAITPLNNSYIIESVFNSIYCYNTFLIK